MENEEITPEVEVVVETQEEEINWNKELTLTLREMRQELAAIREARSQSSQSPLAPNGEPEPEPEPEPETTEIVVEEVQPETEKSPYRSLKSSRHQSG